VTHQKYYALQVIQIISNGFLRLVNQRLIHDNIWSGLNVEVEVEANLIDVIPRPRGTYMCSGPSTHPFGRSNRLVTKILLIHIKVISVY
jgi:hypothetical protein